MNLEKFVKGIDNDIKESWERSSKEQKEFDYCSEKDSFIAAVQTRQDVALIASINAFSAKLLQSIKFGVWTLVLIEGLRFTVEIVF